MKEANQTYVYYSIMIIIMIMIIVIMMMMFTLIEIMIIASVVLRLVPSFPVHHKSRPVKLLNLEETENESCRFEQSRILFTMCHEDKFY